jgi:hypothetical protein
VLVVHYFVAQPYPAVPFCFERCQESLLDGVLFRRLLAPFFLPLAA